MAKYKRPERILYSIKIDYDDWDKLNSYVAGLDCPVSWAVRKAIKDFLNTYVSAGIEIPRETVNPGAAVKKQYYNDSGDPVTKQEWEKWKNGL